MVCRSEVVSNPFRYPDIDISDQKKEKAYRNTGSLCSEKNIFARLIKIATEKSVHELFSLFPHKNQSNSRESGKINVLFSHDGLDEKILLSSSRASKSSQERNEENKQIPRLGREPMNKTKIKLTRTRSFSLQLKVL